MGLDVYFTRRPICIHTDKPCNDIILNFQNPHSERLKSLFKDLYVYASENNVEFEDCLSDAIEHFIIKNTTCDVDNNGDEIAYFRNLWWILQYFNYRDEDYGKDVEVTKNQLEDLTEKSKKLILMVEKHFTDKGLKVKTSPIQYDGKTIRYNSDRSAYLTFENSILTEEMIDEADDICTRALDSSDAYIFYKVCEIYIQLKRTLETTDWNTHKVYISADW